ncbi:hypothetical protein RIF25_14575 [Thermosynechococcaceae cyanobacterium BACA0444]|uniref:Uncharacterized protein n=1 Tax=Pseudocalidococcus azoricus BACA0444 TaxID=2918990 RepID=A0AAE4FTF8_9CYAN|nr:hypothetical protein [Pseudocalidococcus azoricus]MDS3862024.1 hypothetical protein [Pseudocalidococcus azoricus BACA0444]
MSNGLWEPCQTKDLGLRHINQVKPNSLLDTLAMFCSIDDKNEIEAVDLDHENDFLVIHADRIIPVYQVQQTRYEPRLLPRKFVFLLNK